MSVLPDPGPYTLGDLLVGAAPGAGLHLVAREPGVEGDWLGYRDLLDAARRILGGLLARGRPPGTSVGLLLSAPADFLPAFWACLLGGYLPCPLLRPPGDSRPWPAWLAETEAMLGDPLLVTTAETRRALPALDRVLDLESLRAGPSTQRIHRATSGDPAVLMVAPPAVAGRHGPPNCVVLTHANLLAALAAKADRLALGAADTALNWAPYAHGSALLETHLLPLYLGASQVHAEPATVTGDPLHLLRLLDRYRVSLTFARPSFLAQLTELAELAREPVAGLDLSCVRHVVSGGEPFPVATGGRLLDSLAPYRLARTVLRPAFGRPETCAGATYCDGFPDQEADREFAALGTPVAGLALRVTDHADRRVPDGQPGQLQVRGPMVFGQYLRNPVATAAAFTADGWFRTGVPVRAHGSRLDLADPARPE